MSDRETVVVLGTGYVGLPAALLLAKAGLKVTGVDIDKNVVRAIENGVLHIKENQLQALLDDPTVRANLEARQTPVPAETFLIAVPTPLDEQKKIADLTHVIAAVESLLPYLQPGNLVILESTVPPLTCRRLLTPLIEQTGLTVGEDVLLAHCPERILPGNVFHEIVNNDRIIGGVNEASIRKAKELYQHFVQGELLETDDVTAELAKLIENTHRDVNIALANEIASVAENIGVDPLEVIDLANRHPRVNILKPGIGVGGHCICLDPWFIKEVDPANSRLIFTARQINDERPRRMAERIRRRLRDIVDPRIVAVGASYRADTYDLRESPAIKIVELLKEDGYRVTHVDPHVEGMEYKSLVEVCAGADCLAVLVEHSVVAAELQAEESQVRKVMRHPIVVRFYTPEAAKAKSGGG